MRTLVELELFLPVRQPEKKQNNTGRRINEKGI
jgi:hypothetical protein